MASADTGGYVLVASDGGVFPYGDIGFFGSTGGQPLNAPIVGIMTVDKGGYWLVALGRRRSSPTATRTIRLARRNQIERADHHWGGGLSSGGGSPVGISSPGMRRPGDP